VPADHATHKRKHLVKVEMIERSHDRGTRRGELENDEFPGASTLYTS
jgi:hypothetical protein